MAHASIARLPDAFRRHLEGVVVRVPDFATPEQLEAVGLSDPWELSGLYEGNPVSEHSIWESGTMPAIISLFRKPLLAEWRATGVRLPDLVHHVVVHEAGHHFGLSDDAMHAIEDDLDTDF